MAGMLRESLHATATPPPNPGDPALGESQLPKAPPPMAVPLPHQGWAPATAAPVEHTVETWRPIAFEAISPAALAQTAALALREHGYVLDRTQQRAEVLREELAAVEGDLRAERERA